MRQPTSSTIDARLGQSRSISASRSSHPRLGRAHNTTEELDGLGAVRCSVKPMPVWCDPANSNSELVHFLHAWWTNNRGNQDLPDRDALDPNDLKPVLPNLLISDAEHDPFRVRYRLVGTMVVEVTGFNF